MSADLVVVLHAGTMKSGTTYVQSRLDQHRERLAEDGILFPGPRWRDQMRAVGDALARARGGTDLTGAEGPWARMRTQLLGWTGGRVVISVEHMCRADDAQASALVASLRPAEVQVILTTRDLGRIIPSAWQQEIKAGRTETFEDFVQALAATSTGARTVDRSVAGHARARRFWLLYDAAAHAGRWAAAGADRVRVVTVPQAGADPDLLWERFSAAAGLDHERYPAPDLDLVLNPSLGGAGAEFLRRLNLRLGDSLAQDTYRDLVKFTLANAALAGQPDDAPRRVPAEHASWLTARSTTLRDGIRDSGADVVGDLDDLLPASQPPADCPPTSAALALAAARAGAALLGRMSAEHDRGAHRSRRTILAEQVSAARRRVGRQAGGMAGVWT